MRVCFVTGEYPPMRGGVGDYTRELSLALQALGVEVTVVTSRRATPTGEAQPPQSEPRVYPIVDDWGYRSWRQIGRALDEIKPDVVHVQYQTAAYGMHPAINLLPLYLRRRRPRPLLAVTFHDLKVPYLFPKAGPLRRAPAAILARLSDLVVVTNEEDAIAAVRRSSGDGDGATEGLRSRNGGRPSYLIPIGSNIALAPPPGFAREEWRRRVGVGEGELLLSYFGFLGHSKGVDLLFDALRDLTKLRPDCRLAMVGGTAGDSDASTRGYAREIRSLADEPAFRGRVIWTGFTAAPEVSANLLAADICVLPFREGASLRHGTLVAAITHGLAIVTTASPVSTASVAERFLPVGLRLAHRQNCYLVPPESAPALKDAVLELAGNPALAAEMRRGASAMAPLFAWDSIARQTLAAYEEVAR